MVISPPNLVNRLEDVLAGALLSVWRLWESSHIIHEMHLGIECWINIL